MKQPIIAIAIVSLATSAFAQDPPPPGTIELRIVTADLVDPQSSVTVDTTGLSGPVELEFYLQATVVDDPDALSVSVFEARLSDSDDSGTIGKGSLSFREAFNLPSDEPSLLTGMFNNFRATIGNNNDNPGNGFFNFDDGRFTIVPIDLSSRTDAVGGAWVNVYKILWTTNDLSDRMLTLDAEGTDGAYFAEVFNEETQEFEPDLMQPAAVGNASINITFIPAPGTIALTGVGAGLVCMRRRR